MPPIITVEHVAKRFQLGAAQAHYGSLRESLVEAARAPFRRLRRGYGGGGNGDANTIWAVEDVSFEVNAGEIVGIIGRNGAGKSTLLKMLSRITEPTRGRISLYGRVGSLLEVGTGFHPELSGRENIFLNGAILGMSKLEIKSKFDEIVAFAEVERFIDTPVKRYSSGMYLRLAFAVAAHLEPEILLVDEVLAVGDARFQKKCLDKMQDVGRQGRTVLFVSHNMPAITRLCPRTILLDAGKVFRDGPSADVVSAYLSSGLGTSAEREWSGGARAPGNEFVRLCAVRVRDDEGQVTDALDIRRPIGIEMEYEVLRSAPPLVPNLHFYNDEGTLVFILHDCDPQWRGRERAPGHYVSTAWLPGNLLAEGTLIVSAVISTHDPVTIHLDARDAVAFQVIDSLDGNSARGDYAGPMPGMVRPLVPWRTEFRSAHQGGVAVAAEEMAQ